jgi:lipopolysaccharide transport protein LptA
MANTRADFRWWPWGPAPVAALALCACALAASGAEPPAASAAAGAGANPVCGNGNICFTADDTEYRRDRVLLHNIVIYQGGSVLRIEAQTAEASSLDFTDSTWKLDGAVQVRTPQGQLEAAHATVRFAASRLGKALASGSPASFAQQAPADDSTRAARGHALAIDYDPIAGEVQLQGEAYLTDGCNETSSERITYNFAQQRVRAQGTGPGGSGTGGRVQGTIRPQCRPVHAPGSAGSTP